MPDKNEIRAAMKARRKALMPEERKAGGSSGGARPKAFVGFNPVTIVLQKRSDYDAL